MLNDQRYYNVLEIPSCRNIDFFVGTKDNILRFMCKSSPSEYNYYTKVRVLPILSSDHARNTHAYHQRLIHIIKCAIIGFV